jgi:zinc/manganese transport system substrate-binding protein
MRTLARRLALASLLLIPSLALAEPLRIVTTFSILKDFVENVAGDRAVVSTLVPPNGDAHGFEPTPRDVATVARADLVIVNGLQFEGWIDRLIAASGYRGEIIVATRGVDVIANGVTQLGEHGHKDEHGHSGTHAHGSTHGHSDTHAHGSTHGHSGTHAHGSTHGHSGTHAHGSTHGHSGTHAHGSTHGHSDTHAHGSEDPHAWTSPLEAKTYVRNIRDALMQADPAHANAYTARAETYLNQLSELDGWVRSRLETIPEQERRAVVGHDSFAYFGRDYSVDFVAAQGLSTNAEPSAQEIATIIRVLRDRQVRVVFRENITDARLVDQISRDGGGIIGGTLYSDALSGADGRAPDYLSMVRFNVETMVAAFKAAHQEH